MSDARWERGAADIERLGNAGLDVPEFRRQSLRLLRALVSVDAAFFATVDPATLLFTGALSEEPLAAATPLFLDNEFGRDDVNKFADLAGATDSVGTLDHATAGDRMASARYREVIRPLGLGDELRVTLMSGGRCWGVLCLHRQSAQQGFDRREMSLVRRLAPHLGEGLRRGTALFSAFAPADAIAEGPGVIVLDNDLSVISVNPQAQRWLSQLRGADWPAHLDLPLPIYASAAHVLGHEHDAAPAVTRLRRAEGGWLTMHASPLIGAAGNQVAVILDAANESQLSSLMLAARGLTAAQSRVAVLVLQGRSTRQIVNELHISSNTVQEHLRAVFDKFGIGSRRELVAALSGRRP
ncbi:MAG: LuxR family transcriptional regulator [Actinomycetia bacterium]|nr:LuxR family transcriptional regulator [Actinomycetes bacterium]